MSDLVEIGVRAIRDCIRANDMREASYVRAVLATIEANGYKIVPVEPGDDWVHAVGFIATAISDRDWEEFTVDTAKVFLREAIAAAPSLTP